MSNLLDYIRGKLKVHSPSKEWAEIKKLEYTDKKVYEVPTNPKYPPNMTRAFFGLDPIIHIHEDGQVIKIVEGKNVIIQFDSILSEESMNQIKDNIQSQIKENGFAVVDGKCKIVEFDNPKYLIKTK